jgi:hypothetical protein
VKVLVGFSPLLRKAASVGSKAEKYKYKMKKEHYEGNAHCSTCHLTSLEINPHWHKLQF